MSTTTSQMLVHDALVAALRASPVLATGNIKDLRDTNRPMAEDEASQLSVFLDHSLPTPLVGGGAPVDWSTRIRVECIARSVPGVKAFDAATLLGAQVQDRVLNDTALQALVSEVSPAPMQWAEGELDTSLICCKVIFTLSHRAPYSNLIG